MKFVTRHFYVVFLVLMIILCAISIGVSFWAVSNAERLHADLVKDQIYGLKKTFLHDTVQNMIQNIARLRIDNRRRAQSEAEQLVDDLRLLYRLDPSGFG